MERVILHCDANAFYASVECLYTPSIRHRPVAVCGSVEERHGIVLTKNQIAKQFGVQTGEAIWQARQKCPDLICVPPDYGLYIRFSKRMRRIYEEYSDRVESFGLDEAWIDQVLIDNACPQDKVFLLTATKTREYYLVRKELA